MGQDTAITSMNAETGFTQPSLMSFLRQKGIADAIFSKLYETFAYALQDPHVSEADCDKFKGLILEGVARTGSLTIAQLAEILTHIESDELAELSEQHVDEIIESVKKIQSDLTDIPVAFYLALAIQRTETFQRQTLRQENAANYMQADRTPLLDLVVKLLQAAYLYPAISSFVDAYLDFDSFTPIKKKLETFAATQEVKPEGYDSLLQCRVDEHNTLTELPQDFIQSLLEINRAYFSKIKITPSIALWPLMKMCSTVDRFNLAMLQDKDDGVIDKRGRKLICIELDGNSDPVRVMQLVSDGGCQSRLISLPKSESLLTAAEIAAAKKYKAVNINGDIILYKQLFELFKFLDSLMTLFIGRYTDKLLEKKSVGGWKDMINSVAQSLFSWQPFSAPLTDESGIQALRSLITAVMAAPMAEIMRIWYDEEDRTTSENEETESESGLQQITRSIRNSLLENKDVKRIYTELHATLMNTKNQHSYEATDASDSVVIPIERGDDEESAPLGKKQRELHDLFLNTFTDMLIPRQYDPEPSRERILLCCYLLAHELHTTNHTETIERLLEEMKSELLGCQAFTEKDMNDVLHEPLPWLKDKDGEEKTLLQLVFDKKLDKFFDLSKVPSYEDVEAEINNKLHTTIVDVHAPPSTGPSKGQQQGKKKSSKKQGEAQSLLAAESNAEEMQLSSSGKKGNRHRKRLSLDLSNLSSLFGNTHEYGSLIEKEESSAPKDSRKGDRQNWKRRSLDFSWFRQSVDEFADAVEATGAGQEDENTEDGSNPKDEMPPQPSFASWPSSSN